MRLAGRVALLTDRRQQLRRHRDVHRSYASTIVINSTRRLHSDRQLLGSLVQLAAHYASRTRFTLTLAVIQNALQRVARHVLDSRGELNRHVHLLVI